MKRKLLSLLLCLILLSALLYGCGGKENPSVSGENGENKESAQVPQVSGAGNGAELALVTDIGTIDDKSFNQGAWEGLVKYAEENGISKKYYIPAEKTTSSYIETIDLAIEGGAKLVVCPGYLFEETVYKVQYLYPDIKFILLDGEPHSGNEYETASNVMPVIFQEDQAGFLAGYAAVRDGYTKLGFMGGMAAPAVIRYGYGFIQGADAAAAEMGSTAVEVLYHYTGDFVASPETQALAAAWFEAGTEVIFGCGGGVGNSVMVAAETAGKAMIGVDIDQSVESTAVITSAMKELSVSVYDGIKAFYADAFPGGKTTVYNAKNNGIKLPMETSKFRSFTQEEYEAVFEKLVSEEIAVLNDTKLLTDELQLKAVKVSVIE